MGQFPSDSFSSYSQPSLGIWGLLNIRYKSLKLFIAVFIWVSWFPLLRRVLTKQEVFLGSRNGTLASWHESLPTSANLYFPTSLLEGGTQRPLDGTRKCPLVWWSGRADWVWKNGSLPRLDHILPSDCFISYLFLFFGLDRGVKGWGTLWLVDSPWQ